MAKELVKKSTDELLKELENTEEFRRYAEENRDQFSGEPLSRVLSDLLQEKGLTKTEVFRRAEISEDYGYQIFSGLRAPGRGKLLSLAVAMGLSFAETQGLLKRAGLAPLYAKNEFDCVVIYSIFHQKTVVEINEMLFDTLQKTLGDEK